MSLLHCDNRCGGIVNTDSDTECWFETKYGDKCYCEPCREELEAEREAMDAKADDCLAQMGARP